MRNGNNGKHADGEKPPAFDDDTIAFAARMFDYARSGHAEELAQVLAMGLPPNLRNDKGDTLVMLASYHGHADAVRRLLAAGADPGIANDRGQTPLAGACFKGDADVVRALLNGGAAVDGHGGDGRTPLMTAAMFNRMEIVELLLDHGADPSLCDARGMTAEDLAKHLNAPDTSEWLARTKGNRQN
ncbi:MAG: ankyrin repeat domain-containing protein [Janthinobacterium lividum]